MRHCKEAVEEFGRQLSLRPRPKNLWGTYQTLLVQFSSEEELEEAIYLIGFYPEFQEWLKELDRPAYEFQYDERLGIVIPIVYTPWEELQIEDREIIIDRWENIRGTIPDRILQLDAKVEMLQQQVSCEDDWETVCQLFTEISDLASTINDLNIWMRKQQEV